MLQYIKDAKILSIHIIYTYHIQNVHDKQQSCIQIQSNRPMLHNLDVLAKMEALSPR